MMLPAESSAPGRVAQGRAGTIAVPDDVSGVALAALFGALAGLTGAVVSSSIVSKASSSSWTRLWERG